MLWQIFRHVEVSDTGFCNHSVDSRGEWRSKWKKNPLEVINYPALEISLPKIKHRVSAGGGLLCILTLASV